MRSRPVTPSPTSAEHGIDRVPWDQVEPDFLQAWGYPDGQFDPEHLTVYGKSGGGKTYFVRYVTKRRALVRRSHVVVVATKKADSTLSGWGWPIISTWPPGYGENQVIYWAKAKGISAEHRAPQRVAVKKVMDALWVPNSNVLVYWDELTYLEVDLKLKTEIATYYREGRGNGITNIAAMQRPSNVTRLAHSEAGWTVAFPPKDVDDRTRVAEVLGDRRRFAAALDDLDRTKHEFLMRHDRTGETIISHLPAPPRRPRPRRTGVSQRVGYRVPSRSQ